MKISGIIIVKNEEDMLADAIDSLSFCDEVIVVDTGSTDRTVEIAKLLEAKVYTSNEETFSAWRNFGAAKAKGTWLLYIDADERISPELRTEILKQIEKKDAASAYRIERKNYYYGNIAWPSTERLERLFKKSALKEWTGSLHESPQFTGEVKDLDGYLIHYTHRDFSSMVEKTNTWSDTEARLRFENNHPPMASWRFFSVMGRTFIRYYIRDKGYKAGIAGFLESTYQAFSIFITYAKLWELQQKHEKN